MTTGRHFNIQLSAVTDVPHFDAIDQELVRDAPVAIGVTPRNSDPGDFVHVRQTRSLHLQRGRLAGPRFVGDPASTSGDQADRRADFGRAVE